MSSDDPRTVHGVESGGKLNGGKRVVKVNGFSYLIKLELFQIIRELIIQISPFEFKLIKFPILN